MKKIAAATLEENKGGGGLTGYLQGSSIGVMQWKSGLLSSAKSQSLGLFGVMREGF